MIDGFAEYWLLLPQWAVLFVFISHLLAKSVGYSLVTDSGDYPTSPAPTDPQLACHSEPVACCSMTYFSSVAIICCPHGAKTHILNIRGSSTNTLSPVRARFGTGENPFCAVYIILHCLVSKKNSTLDFWTSAANGKCRPIFNNFVTDRFWRNSV